MLIKKPLAGETKRQDIMDFSKYIQVTIGNRLILTMHADTLMISSLEYVRKIVLPVWKKYK
jgi:hypothetical protein